MIAKIEQTERKLAEESLGEILIDMARIAEVYPSMPHDLSGEKYVYQYDARRVGSTEYGNR